MSPTAAEFYPPLTVPAVPELFWLPVDRLVPSPLNPRKTFDDVKLAELAASVAEIGVLEPLVVRVAGADAVSGEPPDGLYEIVAGERRHRAAVRAGLATVPCLVRHLSDAQVLEHALTENRQRHDVHPLEEAEAIQQLLDLDSAYSPASVAKRLGMSTAWVYARLRLLQLSDRVKAAYRAEAITAGHAEELCKLPPDRQDEALATQVFSAALFFGGDLNCGDDDILTVDDAITARRWDLLAQATFPVSQLRRWVNRHTVVDVRDAAVQEAFPEVAEAIAAADDEAAVALVVSAQQYPPLSTAEAKALKVVRFGRWTGIAVDGDTDDLVRSTERCESMRPAIVAHPADITPRAIQVCIKPACPVHRPLADARPRGASETDADRRRREEAQQLEADRQAKAQAREAAWQQVRPQYFAALASVAAKAKVTAKMVRAVIGAFEVTQVHQTFGVKLSDATATAVLLLSFVPTGDWVRRDSTNLQRVGAAIGLTPTEWERKQKAAAPKKTQAASSRRPAPKKAARAKGGR